MLPAVTASCLLPAVTASIHEHKVEFHKKPASQSGGSKIGLAPDLDSFAGPSLPRQPASVEVLTYVVNVLC